MFLQQLTEDKSKHDTYLATSLHKPKAALHSFKTRLVKCQQYWKQNSLFFPQTLVTVTTETEERLKAFERGKVSDVLSKEQYLNFENSSSSK